MHMTGEEKLWSLPGSSGIRTNIWNNSLELLNLEPPTREGIKGIHETPNQSSGRRGERGQGSDYSGILAKAEHACAASSQRHKRPLSPQVPLTYEWGCPFSHPIPHPFNEKKISS